MMNNLIAYDTLSQSIFPIDLNQKRFIYEISVPTCSYRMGVKRMGYVVLLLDSGKIEWESIKVSRRGSCRIGLDMGWDRVISVNDLRGVSPSNIPSVFVSL